MNNSSTKNLATPSSEPLLSFICRYPTVLTGRAKGRLATNNNVPDWYRFQKTKIKNSFKESLGEWTIPQSDLKCELGAIKFTTIRPNKKRIDADSPAISAGKWTADFLVEQGWFEDDDKVQFLYLPVQVCPEYNETMIRVEVYGNHLI